IVALLRGEARVVRRRAVARAGSRSALEEERAGRAAVLSRGGERRAGHARSRGACGGFRRARSWALRASPRPFTGRSFAFTDDSLIRRRGGASVGAWTLALHSALPRRSPPRSR